MIMKTVLLSLIILLFTATGCAAFIRGPFSGKVIDAETKEPIEGAVVVVIWDKAIYGSPGGPSSYFQDAKETLTDKEGNFYIEKYYGFTINPLARIRNASLSLLIYKPGYIVFPSHMYFSKFPKSPFKVSSPTLAKLFTKGKKDIKMEEEVVVDKTALSELLTKEVTIVELPKVKTWLERIESLDSTHFYGYDDVSDSKIANLKRVQKAEEDYLEPIKSKYRYDREKLNIPIDK
ncbi:MAG: hypothetical protein WA240_05310 [Nitrospirota bacterium]